jgi:outer membrane receptor protein involved in Fe transport
VRKFLDVAYRYEAAPLTGWAFRAGIDNLLDKEAYSTGYTNATCSSYNVYPDQGRMLKLTATYRF